MSASNLDALMEAFEAAQDNRPDAFFDLLDEDVVWDVGDFPGGKFHGREGVREFFRQWIGTFEDWDFEVREWLDAGHSVFVHMHQRGRGKSSGTATEIDFWQVWLFLEGRSCASSRSLTASRHSGLRDCWGRARRTSRPCARSTANGNGATSGRWSISTRTFTSSGSTPSWPRPVPRRAASRSLRAACETSSARMST